MIPLFRGFLFHILDKISFDLPFKLRRKMVPQSGIEPTSPAYKTGPHPLKVSGANILAPRRGFDPLTRKLAVSRGNDPLL